MPKRGDDEAPGPGDLTIEHDPVGELILLAAAFVNTVDRQKLTNIFQPEHFFEPKHKVAWEGLMEIERRKLGFDFPTLKRLAPKADLHYLRGLVQDHPESPDNIEFHIDRQLWDFARLTAISGPIDALVKAVQDPTSDPERVRALAKQVTSPFDGYKGRSYLRGRKEVTREMMTDIELRNRGIKSYNYGIERLDYWENNDDKGMPIRRMMPGAVPGGFTVITGARGVGKSTVTALMALNLARLGRKVLYGAWEMRGAVTLELLACMSLKLKRTRFFLPLKEGGLTKEELILVEERAHSISKRIRFMDLPFDRTRGENRSKGGNQRNLDIIHKYIEDSGCDVFIADLWRRCLQETKPEDEEQALSRQQGMLEQTKVHGILVHQQLTKGEQVRTDKRPTAEGAKGSAMWSEAPDTMIGVYRPGVYKAIDDNIMELIILKQRYGKWPISIEFDWDGERGLISGGRTVPYDGDGSGADSGIGEFFGGGQKKKGRR